MSVGGTQSEASTLSTKISFLAPEAHAGIDAIRIPVFVRSNTCQCLLRTVGASVLIDWFQLISVSAAHFKTGLTGRAGHRWLDVLVCARRVPPSDAIDSLQRPSVISSSNLSSSTRSVSRMKPARSGGDEGTNRNYPSLNMRFTESTIQIQQSRVETKRSGFL